MNRFNRYSRLFLAPDAGEPAGGAPAAVLDAPAAIDNPGDYVPESPADIEAMINGTAPAKEPAKKEEPTKPGEKKPDAAKTAKVGEKPKEGDVPVKQLREQYEATKAENTKHAARIAELEKAQSDNPTITDLRTQLTTAQTEAKAAREEADSLQKRIAMHDPAATRKVKELETKFNSDIGSVFEMVPDLSGSYASLVREFGALPRGKEDYSAKFKEFREKVREQFPDDVQAVMDAVNKGHQFNGERGNLESTLREDAGKMMHEENASRWNTASKVLETDLATVLDVPEDIATSDPYNPLMFLKHVAEADPEAFGKQKAQITSFVRGIMIGPKPKTAADFPGMSPEQVTAALQKEQQAFIADRNKSAKYMIQGMMTLANLRGFLEGYKKLEERVEKASKAAPPDPTKAAGVDSPTGDTLKDYVPPTPDELERSVYR